MRDTRVRIITLAAVIVISAAALAGAAALGRYFLGRASMVASWKEENAQTQQETGSGKSVSQNGQQADGAQGLETDIQPEAALDSAMPESLKNPDENTEDNRPLQQEVAPDKVKGIYVTGPLAGNKAFDGLLELVDSTELNAMVIDVKNDDGEITFQMDQETAQEMGACVSYIKDIEAFMSRLKQHNIYTIARIVCFKDPYLAEHFPELALKKPDGLPVTDGNGLAWVNPYREEVWEYLVELARAAREAGFDEVQFDYVRFPIGSDADQADYGVDMELYPRKQAVTGFLTYATEELHKIGMPVTADVFGTIIGSETDVEQVGQDYPQLCSILDVISPMVYPSHYANGVFGLDVPDAHPYETVYAAMKKSAKELETIPQEKCASVRPWLQAFTASWVKGHISYSGDQIRQQIQAVYDAGYEEWILWNAANRYEKDGLMEEF